MADWTVYREDPPEGLPETEGAYWLRRATQLIDRLTLGRAAQYAEEERAALHDACGEIALLLYYRASARAQTRGGLLSGASNDGYSESYVSGAASGSGTGSAAAQAREILSDCLGADEHGLLYRGVGPC